MSNSYSRVPAPKSPAEKKKDSPKRPTQPATKAEVDVLRQKIVEKLENNTDKAVTILTEWLKNHPKR